VKRPRVLLADDHRIVVDGLSALLQHEFELVGVAENGMRLVEMAERERPDVIVADISMPLLNGIDAVRRLRDSGLDAKVVFLTMHPDAAYAARAFDAGASGYVLKHSAHNELVEAIRAALKGVRFISAAVRTPALEERLDPLRRRVRSTIELTLRQREVLQLLAEGKSAKEIAAILDISPRTAEAHKYKIMDEIGVHTTAELVQHAIKLGLIETR
jgi:DNA-binding NarL/FixJ family response regulator